MEILRSFIVLVLGIVLIGLVVVFLPVVFQQEGVFNPYPMIISIGSVLTLFLLAIIHDLRMDIKREEENRSKRPTTEKPRKRS